MTFSVNNFSCFLIFHRIDLVTQDKTFATWIWDAAPVSIKGQICDLALVSSQNDVFLWNWKQNIISSFSSCVEQCILYLSLLSVSIFII